LHGPGEIGRHDTQRFQLGNLFFKLADVIDVVNYFFNLNNNNNTDRQREDHDEILVEKEVKTRENRRTAPRSWRKMGRQIRGYLKPNTLKRSRLMQVKVPNRDGTT
jgi:hypothetical protein